MKKKKKEDGSSFEEGMLKLLRTLPKVLKYLPSDKAKDARSFMMSFQYWLWGSPEILEAMLLLLAKEFVPEIKNAQMVSSEKIVEPILLPDKGIWHPVANRVFEDPLEYFAWYNENLWTSVGFPQEGQVVGVFLQ